MSSSDLGWAEIYREGCISTARSGQQLEFGTLLHSVIEIQSPVPTKANEVGESTLEHPFVEGKVYKKPPGRPSLDLISLHIYKRVELHQMYMNSQKQ